MLAEATSERRNPLFRLIATISAASLLLAGCATAADDELQGDGTRDQVAVGQADAANAVVAATWSLGLAALQTGTDAAGAVVSPSSLMVALAMLAEGASAQEISAFDEALGATGQERTDAVNALLAAVERYDGDPAIVQETSLPQTPMVHTAQQLVVDDQVTASQTFLDRLQHGYGAGLLVTDLGSADGISSLSSWVQQHTGGMVEKSAIEPDPELVAVLQDAVVLAAAWTRPFDPNATSMSSFAVAGGSSTDVETMNGTLVVSSVTDDGWQAVRLPYTPDLAADLYLPPAENDLATNPAGADPQTLVALSEQLDDAPAQALDVSLPTVDLATKTDLMTLLDDLGIAGQPLSAIRADGRPVEVTQAVQQAVLQVAEDGTRAAAVTEIAVGETAVMEPAPSIRFDRPFLLVIRDLDTGWPLFMASISDPRH